MSAASRRAIAAGHIDPKGVIAILGKTEGNGLVNDFARGYATLALESAVPAPSAERAGREDLPGHVGRHRRRHGAALDDIRARGRQGSAGSGARDRPRPHGGACRPSILAGWRRSRCVAAGVRAAMADAGIGDAADVHFVQVKCPLLTVAAHRRGRSSQRNRRDRGHAEIHGPVARGQRAGRRGRRLARSTAACVSDADIGSRLDLWSGRASCSAGVELLGHEIVVFGMSHAWSGPLAIDHAVMADAIDIEPVRAALARLGLAAAGQIPAAERERLIAVLAKAEASHDGRLRGYRHTMLDDSDISSTRHARAFVCGALAGLVGHAEIYVSGGAEHQGPDGGGPVALIAVRNGGG